MAVHKIKSSEIHVSEDNTHVFLTVVFKGKPLSIGFVPANAMAIAIDILRRVRHFAGPSSILWKAKVKPVKTKG